MSKTTPRMCKIFNCDRRHGNFCCADCGYKRNEAERQLQEPLPQRARAVQLRLRAGNQETKKGR